MRDSGLTERESDMPGTAIIRRMRSPRRLRVEAADSIVFDVAAFKLDRKLGIAEHIAVERNLTIVSTWPEVIFENSGQVHFPI